MVLPVESTLSGVHERAGPQRSELGGDAQAFLAILAALLGLMPAGGEAPGNGTMPGEASAAEGRTREPAHRSEESVTPDIVPLGVAQAGLALAGATSSDGQLGGQPTGERLSAALSAETVLDAGTMSAGLGVLTGLVGTPLADDPQPSAMIDQAGAAPPSASPLEGPAAGWAAALGVPSSGAGRAVDGGTQTGQQHVVSDGLLGHSARSAGKLVAVDEAGRVAAQRIVLGNEPARGADAAGAAAYRASEVVRSEPAGARVWVEGQESDSRGSELTVSAARRGRSDDRPALVGALLVSDTGGSRPGMAGPVLTGEEAAASAVGQVQERVAQAIAHGTRQIRVRLEPPDLGVVDVRIRESAGRLEVTLAASQPEVRQALEAGRESLRAFLAAGGLTVQRVEVQPLATASGQHGIGGGQSGMGWPGGHQGTSSDPGWGRPDRTVLDQRLLEGGSRRRALEESESSGLVDTWA
ncbi:flagellar hook-length control protein FliK [Thermomicrobium sp.]